MVWKDVWEFKNIIFLIYDVIVFEFEFKVVGLDNVYDEVIFLII